MSKLLRFKWEGGPKRKKAALFGCGLLENVAELVNQRCRRTRRNPSSSTERRRKEARRLVRFWFIAQGHTAEGQAVSSVLEAANAAVEIVLIRALDLCGDDFADAQGAATRDIDRAVDL